MSRRFQAIQFLSGIALVAAIGCAPGPSERMQETKKPPAHYADQPRTGVTGSDDTLEDMTPEQRSPAGQSDSNGSTRSPSAPQSPRSDGGLPGADQPAGASAAKPATPAWAVIRSAYKADEAVDIHAEWLGGRQIRVTTRNVNRLTLDFTRLPEGAPRNPPWNLMLDRQAIEITGGRGLVLDFDRSPNGIWSVDKKRPVRRSTS